MENKPNTSSPLKMPIIILVLGLALILIAQSIDLKIENYWERHEREKTQKTVKYFGIGLIVIGGILFATRFKTNESYNTVSKQNSNDLNATTNETIEQQLEKLNALRQKDLITDDEFINKKRELLSKL